MRSLSHPLTFIFMVGLTVWVTSVAVRIETQNAAAGSYLPRHDEPGQWRVSRENTPREQLRGLVSTVGLLQYFLAPLLMALAAIHVARPATPLQYGLSISGGIAGLMALCLAFYRGYLSSLGS